MWCPAVGAGGARLRGLAGDTAIRQIDDGKGERVVESIVTDGKYGGHDWMALNSLVLAVRCASVCCVRSGASNARVVVCVTVWPLA